MLLNEPGALAIQPTVVGHAVFFVAVHGSGGVGDECCVGLISLV